MVYCCPRCHYETQNRAKYVRHLQRATLCPNPYSSDSPQDILKNLVAEHELKKIHVCSQCQARFAYKKNLDHHIATLHKDLNGDNNHYNSTDNNHHNSTADNNHHNSSDNNHHNSSDNNHHNTTATQSYNTTNNDNHSTTNNNTTNNTITGNSITININPVGAEEIKHILEDSEFLTKCLRNVLQSGMKDLIEKIHLDPEHPENNNITLQRIKHPAKMKVLTKEEKEATPSWKEISADQALHQIIYRGCDILVRHNNRLYRIKEEIGEATIDDEERYCDRNEKLTDLKKQKRGVYSRVKNNILVSFETDKKNRAEAAKREKIDTHTNTSI